MQFNPALIDLLGESTQSLGLTAKALNTAQRAICSFISDDDEVVAAQWRLIVGAKRLRQAEKASKLASVKAQRLFEAMDRRERSEGAVPKWLLDLHSEAVDLSDSLLEAEEQMEEEVFDLECDAEGAIMELGGCAYPEEMGPKGPSSGYWQDQLGWWNGHGVAGA